MVCYSKKAVINSVTHKEFLHYLFYIEKYAEVAQEIIDYTNLKHSGMCSLILELTADHRKLPKYSVDNNIVRFQVMRRLEKYRKFIKDAEQSLWWFTIEDWVQRYHFIHEIIKVETSFWNRLWFKLGLYPFPKFERSSN